MRHRICGFGLFFVVAAAILMAGCSNKSTNTLAPFQPQINNAQDNFQFQATGVKNVSGTYQYVWSNTGTSANVNQACAITSGTAVLTIFDADTVQVYSRNLTDNGTFQTNPGTTGNWIIRVVLSHCYGTLNFRVQKP